MGEISDHAKNLTLSDDLGKTLEDRVNLFYNFVKVSADLINCAFISLEGIVNVCCCYLEDQPLFH